MLGASIETWCDADGSGVSVSGIDEHLEQTVALADLWFRQPRFTASDVASQLKTALTVRRRHIEDHRYGLGALAEYASRGPLSSYLTAPSNQLLAGATVEDLRKLLTSYPDQKHETLYFGPRPPEALARSVAFGRQHRPLAKRPPRRYRPAGPPAVFLVDRDTAQTTLDLAFTGPPLARRDRVAAIALSYYLSDGLSGVVMRELRETTGLVYSASANYQWGDRSSDDSALIGRRPDASTQGRHCHRPSAGPAAQADGGLRPPGRGEGPGGGDPAQHPSPPAPPGDPGRHLGRLRLRPRSPPAGCAPRSPP